MNERYYCGAARKCITPSAELIKNLRGLMRSRFVYIDDDIYARTVAIKAGRNTVLFIGLDLDKAPYPAETMKAISEKYGIPEENITYYGIHSHSTPVVGDRPGEKFNNTYLISDEVTEACHKYEKLVFDAVLETVEEAIKKLEPCSIAYSTSTCGNNINRNADNFTLGLDGKIVSNRVGGPDASRPCDHTVYVMRMVNENGDTVAILTNYAMHNTVMFMNDFDGNGNLALSSDVGGHLSQALEASFPGSVALWCSGAAGDVAPLEPHVRKPGTHPAGPGMPVHHDEDNKENDEPGSDNFKQKKAIVKQITANLASAVYEALNKIDNYSQHGIVAGSIGWVTPPEEITLSTEGENVRFYNVRVHITRIGDIIFCGIGGELYSSLAFAIRNALPYKKLIIVNHDSSMIWDSDYILDDETWYRQHPEELGKNTKYIPGYMEKSLVNITGKLVYNVMN